jgi:TusA-related sulfurtransferase
VNAPTVAFTVDGTLLTCKGAIAKLEETFSHLPPGSLARVVVNEVPNRIDVRAWADRKGHRIVEDARRGEVFELFIEKDGRRASPNPSRAMTGSS